MRSVVLLGALASVATIGEVWLDAHDGMPPALVDDHPTIIAPVRGRSTVIICTASPCVIHIEQTGPSKFQP